jgi:hypothetical protein
MITCFLFSPLLFVLFTDSCIPYNLFLFLVLRATLFLFPSILILELIWISHTNKTLNTLYLDKSIAKTLFIIDRLCKKHGPNDLLERLVFSIGLEISYNNYHLAF